MYIHRTRHLQYAPMQDLARQAEIPDSSITLQPAENAHPEGMIQSTLNLIICHLYSVSYIKTVTPPQCVLAHRLLT